MAALDGLEGGRSWPGGPTDAARAEDKDALALMQEAERGEFLDDVLRHRWLRVEVEALE
jgi:hypothetical protein